MARVAEATELIDAQLSDYFRAIAVNADPEVVRDNIEMAYQRCIGLQWRGATDAELAIIGSPSKPTR